MPNPEGTSIKSSDKSKRKAASSEQGSGSQRDFAAGKSHHGPAGQREVSHFTSDSSNEATSEQRLAKADALKLFACLEKCYADEVEYSKKVVALYLEEAEAYSQKAQIYPDKAQKYLFKANNSISSGEAHSQNNQFYAEKVKYYVQKKQSLSKSIPTEKEARQLMQETLQDLLEQKQDKLEESQKMLETYIKKAEKDSRFTQLAGDMTPILEARTKEKEELENVSKGLSHNN